MRGKKFADKLKSCAATTARMVEGTKGGEYGKTKENNAGGEEENVGKHTLQQNENLYLGNSWFTSMDAAAFVKGELGSNFIGVLKTSSSCYLSIPVPPEHINEMFVQPMCIYSSF